MTESTTSLEKPELDIAFIPIICAAPLIYAHSHGYFEENGLSVNLRRAPGWSGIKELLVHGLCDAAHMLAPMPFACRQGIDGPPSDVRLSLIQNINGQALTLASKHLGIKDAADMRGLTFGVPYRFSMHYYLLCYFLAAHGVDPLKDVTIKEVAPPQMPFYLKQGWVDGVLAPEPFNQIPVYCGTGFIFILSKDIWPGHPCCCFATHGEFARSCPNTYRAALRSVLQAEYALHQAGPEQRTEIAREISAPAYLNQEESTPVEQALAGDYPDGRGNHLVQPDRIDFLPDPWPEFGCWIVAQMQRWAQMPGKVDYHEILESTLDGEARELIGMLGFESARPTPHSCVELPRPETAFAYVQTQPFAAYEQQAEPHEAHLLPAKTERRLGEIITQLARVAGGYCDTRIDVTSTGKVGHLEQILQETILNLRFSRDALAEQVEHLDHLVHQRTKRLAEEIAARDKVEEELRASRQRYQSMVEATTDYVVAVRVKDGGPIETTHGPGCEAVTGYTTAEFHEQPYLWIDMVPEEDREFVRIRSDRTLAEQDTRPFEHRIVSKDGRVRWVRHTPVLRIDSQGARVGYDSLIRDVTTRKLSELKLQASEEQKALALWGSDLGTWDWSVASGRVEFNSRWAEMLGYSLEELEPNVATWERLVHPNDKPRVMDVLAKHLGEETPYYETRHRVRHKSGRWIYILDKGRVVSRDAQGNPLRVCGTHLDITAQEEAKEAVRASEDKLAGILDSVTDHMSMVDEELNIVWANRVARRLFGEELVGKKCFTVYHNAEEPCQPCICRRAFQDGLQHEHETEVIDGSGTRRVFWCTANVAARHEDGRPKLLVEISRDITERRQQEQRLRLTQFSVDRAPEMIVWLDAGAQVYYVNEAACMLLGYEADEMVGRPLWSLCPEWPETRYLSEPGRLATGASLSFDVVFRHKDGTVIPVEVAVNELKDEQGRHYYCVQGRDIRERRRTMVALKEARTKAEAATRAKTEFLATMSHEIRTPLTAILGYADALRHFGDIAKAPTSRVEMLSAVKRNGNHLLDLINDLLDLSQIEAGQLDLSLTPSSPLALVQEVAANLLERAQSKGLALRVECATPIPRQIQMDPKRFRQILTNLIGNAIKFTDEGHIAVRLAAEDTDGDTQYLAVAVEDTGIGIPAETRDEIFHPFTHGHDQQVRRTPGTGLGLSICRRLVAASGGEITLTSEVGEGSVFTFTIPFARTSPMWCPDSDELAVEQAAYTEREVPQVNLAGTRILLVEDTPDTQDLLALFLEEAGATVSVAADGLDGLAAVREGLRAGSPFDLILMDMRIPGLDGYAATRRLRHEGVRCPIIALTAYAMKDDEQACLDAGCDAYVTKPIDLCCLFDTIKRHVPGLGPRVPRPAEAPQEALVSQKAADARFRPLLEKYLSRLPGLLDQLQSARRDGERETLCAVVHRLRGTGANYGFPQITAIADECETALRTQAMPEQHLDESLDLLTSLVGMAIETAANLEQD